MPFDERARRQSGHLGQHQRALPGRDADHALRRAVRGPEARRHRDHADQGRIRLVVRPAQPVLGMALPSRHHALAPRGRVGGAYPQHLRHHARDLRQGDSGHPLHGGGGRRPDGARGAIRHLWHRGSVRARPEGAGGTDLLPAAQSRRDRDRRQCRARAVAGGRDRDPGAAILPVAGDRRGAGPAGRRDRPRGREVQELRPQVQADRAEKGGGQVQAGSEEDRQAQEVGAGITTSPILSSRTFRSCGSVRRVTRRSTSLGIPKWLAKLRSAGHCSRWSRQVPVAWRETG